jgi:hypothetical protein
VLGQSWPPRHPEYPISIPLNLPKGYGVGLRVAKWGAFFSLCGAPRQWGLIIEQSHLATWVAKSLGALVSRAFYSAKSGYLALVRACRPRGRGQSHLATWVAKLLGALVSRAFYSAKSGYLALVRACRPRGRGQSHLATWVAKSLGALVSRAFYSAKSGYLALVRACRPRGRGLIAPNAFALG